MKIALDYAKEAIKDNEVPIAAIIVRNNEVIAKAYNQVFKSNDVTAHAEILAIRKASEILKTPYLNDCDIYVTLEPCAMCAKAISLAKIRRLYYACSDNKGGAVESGPKVFSSNCNHIPEIYSSILEDEASQMLKSFFKDKR